MVDIPMMAAESLAEQCAHTDIDFVMNYIG